MKALTIVLGQPGRGKSTSVRTLDPKSTVVFNTEGKELPFKNAKEFTQVPIDPETMGIDAPLKMIDYLKRLRKDKKFETVVIDSFSAWTDMLQQYCSKTEKGFEIYNRYNNTIYEFFQALKSCDKYVFILGHDEVLQTEEGETIKRLKVNGKKWEGLCEKEALCVLYATVRKQDDGSMKYLLETQTDGITPSKSPMGMFENFEIDNDLGFVLDSIKKYYEPVKVEKIDKSKKKTTNETKK